MKKIDEKIFQIQMNLKCKVLGYTQYKTKQNNF